MRVAHLLAQTFAGASLRAAVPNAGKVRDRDHAHPYECGLASLLAAGK
jgi:hypothetical protein